MQDESEIIREEEEAAAEEARRIGGRSGMEGMDEAERSAAEHGGGEAEGFEQAEELLEEGASHGESSVYPLSGEAEREAEAEPDPSTHGEADEPREAEDDER